MRYQQENLNIKLRPAAGGILVLFEVWFGEWNGIARVVGRVGAPVVVSTSKYPEFGMYM